uniref:Uncharacterized protein n=1 Tax=Otus sunia TaxID=257818 RepID=A0A8C8AT60_9STRI
MSYRELCQEASHASSWDTASGPQLNAQLEGWLSQAQSTKRPVRALLHMNQYCSPYKLQMPQLTLEQRLP